MSYEPAAQIEQLSMVGQIIPNWLISSLYDTTSKGEEPTDFQWYLAGRALYQHPGYSFSCQTIFQQESAEPSKLSFSFSVSASNHNYVVQAFKNQAQYISHSKGHLGKGSWQIIGNNLALGPPDDAWTVRTWIDVAKCEVPLQSELSAAKKQLDALLEAFRQGTPIDRPESLLQLAEKVAEQNKQPDGQSIKSWAEELAQKLSKLAD